MKKASLYLVVSLLIGVAASLPAAAAQQSSAGTSPTLGVDVSYPQCGSTLPKNAAFGIVGVNGGTASKVNPCLSSQLVWANKTPGLPSQPKVQLYVNTANPGEIIDQVTTWPTDNVDQNGNMTTNPYGDCSGGNDLACSWQYGWERAVAAVNWFVPAAMQAGIGSNPGDYTWWLDVEVDNTWQSGSADAYARNAATLEGMTAYYQGLQAKVGVYSTNYQWNQVVALSVSPTSNLNGLDNWMAGARSLKGAQANCQNAPFTPGAAVTLAQYVSKGFDYNYSCR